MTHRIIVEFKNKEDADYFCGQLSDGWGEGNCDFSSWRRLPNTDGTKREHFVKVTDSAPEGTPVYFVKSVERY